MNLIRFKNDIHCITIIIHIDVNLQTNLNRPFSIIDTDKSFY
ncbi:hypothetical protein CCACVL1_06602 [Corchorus capsularis]|uniref:Uncharacterized protein n=1 Tax=Corchorus capsularis TaxID=210143 RepID=A0A1R3JE87_COCAP|nr:hypothetical protein CCACVL1_06602 [Corchorus capsularis]